MRFLEVPKTEWVVCDLFSITELKFVRLRISPSLPTQNYYYIYLLNELSRRRYTFYKLKVLPSAHKNARWDRACTADDDDYSNVTLSSLSLLLSSSVRAIAVATRTKAAAAALAFPCRNARSPHAACHIPSLCTYITWALSSKFQIINKLFT